MEKFRYWLFHSNPPVQTVQDALVTFRLADVPQYLQSSDFFKTLDPEDDEAISLPDHNIKWDTDVNSVKDAHHLLTTLLFWGSDEIPGSIMNVFNLKERNDTIVADLREKFGSEYKIVNFLCDVAELEYFDRIHFALKAGLPSIVKYLVYKDQIWDRTMAARYACMGGNLECLQYIHQQGAQLNGLVCTAAARAGHVSCFEYIHDNGVELIAQYPSLAAEHGHLELLKYLHAHECPWDGETCRCAAEHNHIECLKFAHENGCPWDRHTTTGAAASGHLLILQYAHDQGCQWSADTVNNAAYHDHLNCLVYLHEHGAPWNYIAPYHAAMAGSIECLRYCLENSCPYNTMVADITAEKNHLEILQLLGQHGCSLGENIYRWAAHHDNLIMMQLGLDHGCGWENYSQAVSTACKRGSLACLQFLFEHAPCTHSRVISVYNLALIAHSGQVSCFKYALRRDLLPCKHSVEICIAAVASGSLECIQCAHAAGYVWDASVTNRAAEKGAVDCLRYCVEQGCAVQLTHLQYVLRDGRFPECVAYVNSLVLQGEEPQAVRRCC